jgi:hypothetical protein
MRDTKRWPATEVSMRPVKDLVPYARNARTHSAKQVDKIAASMQEWGWTNPVLVDEKNGIITGHGRILAAQKMGYAEVPCMVARGWTDAQKRAYVIADNQLALEAGWDREMLSIEFAELDALDFNLELTGFDDLEIKSFLGRGDELEDDPDKVPEKPEVPVSRPGDLWLLGKHRVLCGDSTSAECVTRLLNGEEPRLMVTDPPYGVEYDPDWRNRAGVSSTKRTGKVANDDRVDWTEVWKLVPCDVSLRLARREAWRRGRCQPAHRGLRDPLADHLGQEPVRAFARQLPLAARALLVRGAQRP